MDSTNFNSDWNRADISVCNQDDQAIFLPREILNLILNACEPDQLRAMSCVTKAWSWSVKDVVDNKGLSLQGMGFSSAATAIDYAIARNLSALHLGWFDTGDKNIKDLSTKLPNLTQLNLFMGRVGDEGLRELAKLSNLIHLNFSLGWITDKGAVELAKLSNLTQLNLQSTKIADQGAVELAKLSNLRILR